MKDPFFLKPMPWLVQLTQPLADYLCLPTLSLHIHEVVWAALFYTTIYLFISPFVSKRLFPTCYSTISHRTRINWDARVVSTVQCCLINVLAIWVMIHDDERRRMTAVERVWGYSGASGMLQALFVGYFVFDLLVSSIHLDVFGFGTLFHAICALLVYTIGFKPFINYYGCIFILWELSTPFLNIHWFMDKLGMTGTRAQLYNGLMLLFMFFSCRLVWGTWESINVHRDIWFMMKYNKHFDEPFLEDVQSTRTMKYAPDSLMIPQWLGLCVFISNMVLNFLNFYWFYLMVKAVQKRFQPTSIQSTSSLRHVKDKRI